MTLIDHRYQILAVLGGSPSAQVFRVHDILLNQPRVLKGVDGPLEGAASIQLRREYELLLRVQHPRVVRVHDLGLSERAPVSSSDAADLSTGPFLYFTLDYVAGPNLRAALHDPLEVRLRCFAELAEGVRAVHQHGLRCGDLKPENALLGLNGVQLIDFGLSREAESLEVGLLPTGTLPYMAPELLQGRAGDLRADLFSLGVVLFELLSGRPPFPNADTPSSRLQAWQSFAGRARDLLPEKLRHLPEPLLSLLDRLLSISPSGRPADAGVVYPALDGLSIDAGRVLRLAPWPSRLAEQPLVGREAEIERLLSHYRTAMARGQGRIDLVGPEGVGKSRLLSALATELLPVTQGRLVRLSGAAVPDSVRAQLGRWLLQGRLPYEPAPEWLAWLEAARRRSVSSGLPPVALLLDGVRLDAPDGLTPPGWTGLPGLWICRIPDDGRADSIPAADDRLELSGLPAESIRWLVEQASGLVRAPETIARFHRFSEGNPAILRAVLRLPDEMADPSEALLELLRPLAEADLKGLSGPAREAARSAALLREPIAVDVLAGLLELSRDKLLPLLTELVHGAVLTLETEAPGGYRFRRPIVGAVLSAELDPDRRQELHRRAGRLLERRLQLGGQVSNAALAWHFDRTDDGERARLYLRRALREAVQANALLEAHDLCHRVLARLPDGDPERTRVLGQLGDLNLSLQRFPQAEAAFSAALATLEPEAESDPLVEQLKSDLLARLARAREERGDFSGAREQLQQALALGGWTADGLPEVLASPEMGRLALALGRVCHREGRLEEARVALASGIRVLERHHEQGDLVEALVLDGLIRMESGDPEGAAASLTRALELASDAGLTSGRMRALHNLHILEARRGNLDRAVEYLQEALGLAESVGDMARLGGGYNNLGNLQRRQGDTRSALRSYRRAIRTFERVGDRAGLVTVHYSLADLLRERGEHGRALEHLDEAETLANALGGGFREQALQRTRLVRGEVLVALGRSGEARPLLEQARREAEARGDREATLVAELGLAEVFLAAGDTAEVERRCVELSRATSEGRQGIAVERTLARLHFHLGHHYGDAYIDHSRRRSPERHGTALLEVTRASLPTGGAGALRISLEEAVRELEGSGRGDLATRTRELLEALGTGSEERLELLKGVLDLLQNLGDRRQVLASLVSLAARVLRAERGLLLYRRGEEVVDFTALHGMNLGEAHRVSGEIVRRVVETRGPVFVSDALEDPSLMGSASIQDLQIRSVLGLPVDRDEHGTWILYLDHRHLPGVFSPDSRSLLERLSQLAQGLLREVRWREHMLARVESPEANIRRYGMVGTSRAIERVREYIDNLGHLKLANENLLFIGESGTGKELVARAVHQVIRAGRDIPFIAQSCADIPAELIESTLFGHRRGAFTGAREDRPGIFELAEGGVLFLDEIGELPLPLQASLLRVLEERAVARIGEPEKLRPLNLIVVCATNRDLAKEVDAGRFRRDLFHRLNQVFRLPPLRERREDILPLLRHFMANVEDFGGLGPEEVFSPEVLLWFHDHPWPGNIRELKNMVEAIPVRIKARRRQPVTLEDLGVRAWNRQESPTSSPSPDESNTGETLKDFTDRMEAGYIRRVMEQCEWDITTASARLGLTYQGLRKRLIRYDWMDEVERRRR